MPNNSLSAKTKKLLTAHGLFLYGRVAFDTFINIYIWRLTNDLHTILIFNIIYDMTHTAMFFIFANMVKMGKTNLVKNIGLIGFSAVYFLLFLLKEQSIQYLPLFALMVGIFNGMYWVAYHTNRFDMTESHNRGNFTGIERGIKIIVKLIGPPIGGFIISRNLFGSGYSTLFLLAFIFYLISMFFGQIEFKHKPQKVHFKKTWNLIKKKPVILKSFFATTMSGFSMEGSLVSLVIPLLILEKSGSELELGSLVSIFALISIITTLVIGKFIKYDYYDELIKIGGISFIIGLIALIAYPTYLTIIIFGIVQQIISNFISIPRRVYSDNLIDTLGVDISQHRVEYLNIKELFNVGFGYTLSYIILFLVKDFDITKLYFFAGVIIVAMIVQMYLLLSIRFKDLTTSQNS